MNKNSRKRGVSVILAVVLCFTGIQMTVADTSAIGKVTVTVSKRAKTTATLKIGKMKGVTGYQIFVAGSSKGKYKQIGATRTNRFVLTKLKKNKVYFVKARAYRTRGTRIVTGKYSTVLRIGKFVNTTTAEKYAAAVLALVNQEREKEGLVALKASSALNAAANIRARELVTSNSPTRPDGRNGCSVLTDQGIVYETAGENIASGVRTPKEVVAEWMKDAGHRAQIMSEDYTHMGLGYYATSKGDKYYWSQLFIK